MRSLISTVLLLLMIPSAAVAQEQVPAGSSERGHQVYMKYMCYTCHGTIGQ
jgi:cytochrome c553